MKKRTRVEAEENSSVLEGVLLSTRVEKKRLG